MQAGPPGRDAGTTARFRPIVDLDDGVVVGAEAAAGSTAADLAAPVAAWRDHLGPSVTSVPDLVLTPVADLWRQQDAAHAVRHALLATGQPPDQLVLTVVPAALVGGGLRASLAEVTALGVRLALGGFGTGETLLAVRELPVAAVRLSPRLVAAASRDAGSARVLAHLVGLADDLGLVTVADGVDEDEAVEVVVAAGVRLACGPRLGGYAAPVAVGREPSTAAGRAAAPTPGTGSRVPTADR